jgi:hypothetical protein
MENNWVACINGELKSVVGLKFEPNKSFNDTLTWTDLDNVTHTAKATEDGKVTLNGKEIDNLQDVQTVLSMIIKGLCAPFNVR